MRLGLHVRRGSPNDLLGDVRLHVEANTGFLSLPLGGLHCNEHETTRNGTPFGCFRVGAAIISNEIALG